MHRSFSRRQRIVIAAAVSAVVLSIIPASRADAQAVPAATKTAQPKPPLWVMRQSRTVIYLMGTIHFLPPGAAWRTPSVVASLSASDTLVLEVADPAVLPLLRQYGFAQIARFAPGNFT